jgi:signal transduction histidine kinase
MKSLGSRLTVWYVAVVMATMVCAILVGRWLLIKEMFRGYDVLNAAEFQEIRSRVKEGPGPIPQSELVARVAAHARIDAALYLFQIRRADGKVIFRSDNLGASLLQPNPPGTPHYTTHCEDVGQVRVSQFTEGPLTVQIASPLRNVDHLFVAYFQVGLIVMAMVLVMSVFFGLWLKNMALAPIRRIERTALRITGDNLGERIPVGAGNDEVTDLARLLNKMFDRLEKSFFQLWRFAGNASHELKTPLSIIRLQSEKLLMQGDLSSAQQESVQQQLEGISRLATVIEKLLFLARSEVGAVHMNLKAQSTAALIRGFCEDASVLCEEAKVGFVIEKNMDAVATFDAALMRQVLLNLLSNALRFTPAAGQVTLSSWADRQNWLVSIEDTGPGLPAEALEDVFEPFVRASAPSAPVEGGKDGAGLGLAICRSILQLHHGSIRGANRAPGPGFCITFVMPCAQTMPPQTIPRWVRQVPDPRPAAA